MIEQAGNWLRDGIDPGWYFADRIGSVRNSRSYRAGGWWFLPAWAPDSAEFDVGPFRNRAEAFAAAENLAAKQP